MAKRKVIKKEQNLKAYTVLDKFTKERVYYPGESITLDPDSNQTTYLLINKIIK